MTKSLPALSGLLNPGETAFLVGSTDTWVPAADTFVLTTQRLLVTMGKNLSKTHAWHEITGFTAVPEKRGLKVFLRADDPYNINRLKPEDQAALQAALDVFPTMGPGSAAWNAWGQRRSALLSPRACAPAYHCCEQLPTVPGYCDAGEPRPCDAVQRRSAESGTRTSATRRRGSLCTPAGLPLSPGGCA